MFILHDLLKELKDQFSESRKGEERGTWFIYTLLAIIIPFTSSKTSNLLRCLKALFGFTLINKKRYYTFMASPKIPWRRLWLCVWKLIPDPATDGRIMLALDDYINPKTGRKIYGCDKVFDHAAKQNQSKYPWAQNIVAVGLLKIVKGRWACLPLCFQFYHLIKTIKEIKPKFRGKKVKFQTKLEQAAEMINDVAKAFSGSHLIAVTDSWFGNNGLWKPLREKLGERFHLISRLRSNNTIFEPYEQKEQKVVGRPRKYGKKLGATSLLADEYRHLACEYTVNLYGRIRPVIAYDRLVMVKTLKCMIKVVWVYRKSQWVALFSTDTTLSVEQIIEYYGARWKIEAAFKELKQDIGSAETQNRNPVSVTNHLHFCMMAISLTWIYACRLKKTPSRRHAVSGRGHFAFSDVRRTVADAALQNNFDRLFPVPRKSIINSFVAVLTRMAA